MHASCPHLRRALCPALLALRGEITPKRGCLPRSSARCRSWGLPRGARFPDAGESGKKCGMVSDRGMDGLSHQYLGGRAGFQHLRLDRNAGNHHLGRIS